MLQSAIRNFILIIAITILPTNAYAASCSLTNLLGNWMLYITPATDWRQKTLVCQASATAVNGTILEYTLSNCPETSYPYTVRIAMSSSSRCTFYFQRMEYTGNQFGVLSPDDFVTSSFTLNQNLNIFLGSTINPSGTLGYHYTVMGVRID